jgi:hypothetical protein
MKQRNKFSPEDLHARLIVTIGIILAIVFAGSVFALLYALLFITQPLGEQAPNDAAFIDLVSTLCVFLTGSLAGVLAGNGLKSSVGKSIVDPSAACAMDTSMSVTRSSSSR